LRPWTHCVTFAGTHFKEDGNPWNAVDIQRVEKLMAAVHAFRGQPETWGYGRSSKATLSIWYVWGNMSTGCTWRST